MLYGVDTTYPDERNNCQIGRSGPNFNEVQKVIPKQSNEIDCTLIFDVSQLFVLLFAHKPFNWV